MLEYEIYKWLRDQGFEIPDYKLFEPGEVLSATKFPAVLKIVSEKVVHKTDVGGVITEIQNNEDLNAAKQTILSNLCHHQIEVKPGIDKFMVVPMERGIELFFGIVQDPVFEKVVVFGAGGIYAELFKDVCFIDSEADDEEIYRSIQQTKIGKLFSEGFRGKKYDKQLLINFIKKLQLLDVDEMDLNPVILSNNGLKIIDARLKLKTKDPKLKDLKFVPELFNPRKVAIIGVSSHIEKVGYALAKNTANNSNVYYVNPNIKTLLGKKVYNHINELPEVDTAVLAIPSKAIKESIELLVSKKVKTIVVITAGFKEAGRDEQFLTELAATHQINIIGPNCLGIYANGLNLTFGSNTIEKGNVNLFSQSGAIVAELMDKSFLKKAGFENIISVGNMADIDFADLINSYKGTLPINLYIEGVTNGKNLLRSIRKSKRPIKIFKAGKTEEARKAAFSHTGNLAGNYEMFISLMKSNNVQIIDNVNGLLYPYHFKKILMITNAGGVGTIMSDLINDKLYKLTQEEINQLGTALPFHWSKNNPIDIIGDADKERYLKTLRIADEFGADAIYVLITPQFMTKPLEICRIFVESNFKTKIFPVLLGGIMMEAPKKYLRDHRIEYFDEVLEAVSFL